MKVITTKLRRFKVVNYIVSIVLIPVRFPISLAFKLVESENLGKAMDKVSMFGYRMIEKISEMFKFEETARKQYETNPDKFLN
jgi:hypothetical protein